LILRPEARPAPKELEDDFPLQILVAEDNPLNRMMLHSLLESAGLVVVSVGDGLQAVEAWRSQNWDAILMDIHMPGLGGREATEEIRRLELAEGISRTPIIALTGDVMEERCKVYLAAGMDAVAAKPIDLESLLETIGNLVIQPTRGLGQVA
jgi:two-component system, sensor histidine kinase